MLKQDLSPDSLRFLFDQITRDREAIVCTSLPRVRLVANEALGLDYLFGHYAYEKPQNMTVSQTEALQRVMNLLDSSGISSTEAKDEKNIMEFAKGSL